MTRSMRGFCLFLAATMLTACGGPGYVRDTDNRELDRAAMGTGLDKVDLEALFKETSEHLMDSGAMTRWRRMAANGQEATIAIRPIRNETDEHIDSQLQALLSDFEETLANSGEVAVISQERQGELIAELKRQQSKVFDSDKNAEFAKMLGAKYFITGKIYGNTEKTGGERRVQYFLYMQAIEVETGVVRWTKKATKTKGLIN